MHIIICSSIWIFVFILLSWRLTTVVSKAFNHLHRLHQIPCSNCAFFTGDYRLKCTVNPTNAMSEDAIGCRDFVGQSNSTFNNCHGCARKTQLKKTLIFNHNSVISHENVSNSTICLD